MNILLAIAVMIVIIIASYLADRKYPTKRIFILFLVALFYFVL